MTQFNVAADRPTDNLQPGDVVTVGIRLSDGRDVFGLGASAYDYDESVIDFESGVAVSAINREIIIPGITTTQGIVNYAIPMKDRQRDRPGPLAESSIGSNGSRVLFFNGVHLYPTSSNPSDLGLLGVAGAGDVQFRLVFRAIEPGRTVIRIGTGYEGDGEVGPGGALNTSANVEVAITVIPEPGTGLLVGLGLAGLATGARGRNPAA